MVLAGHRVCSFSPRSGPASSTRLGCAHRVLRIYFLLAALTLPSSWSSTPRNRPRTVVVMSSLQYQRPQPRPKLYVGFISVLLVRTHRIRDVVACLLADRVRHPVSLCSPLLTPWHVDHPTACPEIGCRAPFPLADMSRCSPPQSCQASKPVVDNCFRFIATCDHPCLLAMHLTPLF